MTASTGRAGCLAAAVLLAATLTATPPSGAEQAQEEVEIRAQRVELDRSGGEARFRGEVLLRRGEQLELRCERLVARVGEDGAIASVEASGGVRIEARGITASAGAARYDLGAQRIVLRGDPLVRHQSGELRGRVITIELASGRVSIEGARGVFRVR